METITFWENICSPLKCKIEIGREMENQLLNSIVNVELVCDDKVMPRYDILEAYLDYEKYEIQVKGI